MNHYCEMNIGWHGEEPILCERIARFKDEFGNWRCAYHWDIEQAAEEERRRNPPVVDDDLTSLGF